MFALDGFAPLSFCYLLAHAGEAHVVLLLIELVQFNQSIMKAGMPQHTVSRRACLTWCCLWLQLAV
jgi:hypothetical protein